MILKLLLSIFLAIKTP